MNCLVSTMENLPSAFCNPADEATLLVVRIPTSRPSSCADDTVAIRGSKPEEHPHYPEQVLRLDPSDFPRSRPSETEASDYINQSLEMERTLAPDSSKSPLGKAEHTRPFWEAFRREKYYSFDEETVVLEDEK
jgi:hypothetical protein